MVRKTLDKLAALCLGHSRRLLVFGFVLGLVAIVAASHLRFDPDLLNLVPAHNREINEFRSVLEQMGTIDYHIVVVKVPPGQHADEYEPLVARLARQYKALPQIEDVEWKLPNPLDLIDRVLPHSMLLLTPRELQQVGDRLTDQAIREAVTRDRDLLRTPQAMAMKDVVLHDPFDLLPIYISRLDNGTGGFRLDTSSGYYLSEDHSTLLILTKPRRPAQDIPFSHDLMAHAKRIQDRVLAQFHAESPKIPLPEIAYTGGYAIAHGDAALIKHDVIANVLFSFFGVLFLFLYAFRRVAAIGYAGIPMSLGIAMTFGVAGLTFGTLSSASAGFAALLAGLGIDFITVLYERYIEERNNDAPFAEALKTTIRSTMPGVGVAAITTAGTFYAFLATDFRGMTQLGFLTGTGILLFFLCVALLLPSLIVEVESRTTRVPRLFLHTFGSDRLIKWSISHPRRMIGAWILFLAVSSVLCLQLRFSDNIQNLRAKGNEGVLTQAYLTKKFGQSFDYMMLVVHGKSRTEAIEKTAALDSKLDELARDHVIATHQSVTQFLPPPSQQRKIIQALAAGRNDRFSPTRIRKTFTEALTAQGFRVAPWDDFMQRFDKALTPSKPVTPGELGDPTLERLLGRFLAHTDQGVISVIYIYPAKGVWDREVPTRLMNLVKGHDDLTLTGVNLVSAVLRRIVRADAIRSTLIGFILVFLLLAGFFRSMKSAIIIFIPFLAGCVGMLGLMSAFGIEFNFMNVFVGLMLVGCGTDYGIYMLQRYRENPTEFHIHAPDTGKAVVMAALTSIVGYGSFAISHYPGLRSIGYASTFGIGLSGLAAITLLPAMLMLGARRAIAANAATTDDKPESSV